MAQCPFCTLPESRVVERNGAAVAIRDAFPISPGHTLIIPFRHVASFFETSTAERNAMLALLDSARERLTTELAPAGFNIGINDGFAAGQTVAHVHLHLIPRFIGDREDPRGGLRWVLPEKADYWTKQ